jgi:hypothetical protein
VRHEQLAKVQELLGSLNQIHYKLASSLVESSVFGTNLPILSQTDTNDLGALCLAFGSSLSSRQTWVLSDQISWAAWMWSVGPQCGATPAQVEKAQSAGLVSVKSETQKGTS